MHTLRRLQIAETSGILIYRIVIVIDLNGNESGIK